MMTTNLRRRIVAVALQEFSRHGIKAVKMDDIARILSISKRTLYQVFEEKQQLLLECLKSRREQNLQYMQHFEQKGCNVIEILIAFYQLRIRQMRGVNPSFFLDLQRYPAVVSYCQENREDELRRSLLFFERGQKEGFFRTDLHYEIIVYVAQSAIENVMSKKLYEKYSLSELFDTFVLTLVRGVCTTKGIKTLDTCIENLPPSLD
ncbi:MAG: TetR/AcrR family transcriptional regulator [Prevotella sp.]|nr:TetR/AcrR family transcriptional regulator [Prevotella sp.]